MFLHELGSSDSRFKRLQFHEGMNILVADKTTESTAGHSRNGAGKTSFVRIIRYLLGGNIPDSLRAEALSAHSFWAKFDFGNAEGISRVERPISPRTKVYINDEAYNLDDWKRQLADIVGIPNAGTRPTAAEVFAQVARDYFSNPLKIHQSEADWESGARIGFFLGFSPEILAKAGEVAKLEKEQKTLKKAISEGVIAAFKLSEPELRVSLAKAREKRSRLESRIKGFRVDEQYADHQADADRLTHAIRDLNDEGLSLEQRKNDLELVMAEEHSPVVGMDMAKHLERMYTEVGIVLPGAVARRFTEVADFHASVVRNRQMYLEAELQAVTKRLEEVNSERQALDEQRSRVMNLLNDSMALETFRSAERDLTELDALVADLEQKLALVQSVSDIDIRLRTMKSEAQASVRTEIGDLELALEAAIVLFQQLGEEIYSDRNVSLLIEATRNGALKVVPKIDCDASAGILGVKTFLLDMVCLISAMQLGRAPRIIVHDSYLFDSMDDRQIAACLKIGARLAAEFGFQYVVTLNSDRLTAAEAEGFTRKSYVIDPVLTDAGEEGGLFGFRFV